MNVVTKINSTELDLLFRRLGQIRNEVDAKKELRKAFIAGGKVMAQEIKNKTPVKTGKLKQSIGIIPYLGSKIGKVFIGVKKEKVAKKKTFTTFYGSLLEFGTRYIRKDKHAFFFKAAETAVTKTLDVIQRKLTNRLKTIGNGR